MTTVRQSAPDHAVPVPAMAAETRTIGPARPQTRVPLAVWIVAGAVVTLLVVLIVVTRGGRGADGTGSGSTMSSGSGADLGTAAVATVTPDAATPDAPTPDAALAVTPPDARVPPDAAPSRPTHRAGRPDARTATAKPPGDDCTFDRGAAQTATISVTAEPWALVEVDGKDYGQTPKKVKVAPGCHVVRLSNDGLDKHERKRVVVDAGQTRPVGVDWR